MKLRRLGCKTGGQLNVVAASDREKIPSQTVKFGGALELAKSGTERRRSEQV